MNFMKNKAGFTLVELIVVIAILGILAGIAIPAYSGYIKKANETKDTQVLSAIYTAAVSTCATDTNAPAEITVSATSGNISKVEVDGTQVYPKAATVTVKQTDFALYIGNTISDAADTNEFVEDGTYASGATWEDGKWTAN